MRSYGDIFDNLGIQTGWSVWLWLNQRTRETSQSKIIEVAEFARQTQFEMLDYGTGMNVLGQRKPVKVLYIYCILL